MAIGRKGITITNSSFHYAKSESVMDKKQLHLNPKYDNILRRHQKNCHSHRILPLKIVI